MSITFGCPECMVQIEVADEHAGESGECPRCKRMIVIPSPNQPAPVLMGAKVVPMPVDEPPPMPRRAETASPRRVRPTAAPKQPSGPIWPWVLGGFVALVVAVLLISSFIVLVAWRRAEPTRPAAAIVDVNLGRKLPVLNQVVIGRLEGPRAVMQDGVFQIRSELNIDDPVDPEEGVCRCKRFEIQLRRDRTYIIEQTTNQFDSFIRVEDINGGNQQRVGNVGVRNISMVYRPPHDGNFVVFATCVQPGFGNFTLTISEERKLPRKDF